MPFSFMALSAGYSPYIPWDTNLFEKAVAIFRSNIGSAFNIGIWIFFIVAGISVVIRIVSMIKGD